MFRFKVGSFFGLPFAMKLSSGLLLATAAQAVKNITVYHVNPHEFGAIPVNMDTGDAQRPVAVTILREKSSPSCFW